MLSLEKFISFGKPVEIIEFFIDFTFETLINSESLKDC